MRVLVLGAGGMIGHQVWQKCIENFAPEQVGCTLHKSRDHYASFSIFKMGQVFDQLDLGDFAEAQKVLQKFKPTHVINAAGITRRKKEIQNMTLAYEINSLFPHRLALWAAKNNARVIQFGTDCVFEGEKGNYSEGDIPTATDTYGKSKFLGEIYYPNSLTLRLSMIGRELEGKTELLEWFLAQKGRTVKGFTKAKYSGLTTNFVAAELIKIIKNKSELSGLYQISGEAITKFDLLQMINKIFKVNAEITPSEEYVSDKTLLSDKYSVKTGFKSPSWEKLLLEIYNDHRVAYGE